MKLRPPLSLSLSQAGENLSTLQFAQRAGTIAARAQLNAEVDYARLYAIAQARLDARDDADNARAIEASALRAKLDEAERARARRPRPSARAPRCGSSARSRRTTRASTRCARRRTARAASARSRR